MGIKNINLMRNIIDHIRKDPDSLGIFLPYLNANYPEVMVKRNFERLDYFLENYLDSVEKSGA